MLRKIVMEGIFAINKPSGITSSHFLNQINRVFTGSPVFQEDLNQMRKQKVQQGGKKWLNKKLKVKMGHGGTLDPLASGVMVVGVGSGTKKLGNYTNGSVKVYETVALLGGSTTTGDSEGELLTRTDVGHINKELLLSVSEKFVGSLNQTPPIFSALKMDGKPLYEYARKGLPLPREIKSRDVTVYELTVHDDSLSTDHDYKFLKSEEIKGENGEEKSEESIVSLLSKNPTLNDHKISFAKEFLEKAKNDPSLKTEPEEVYPLTDPTKYDSDEFRAPIIHFTSKVSSGTYIRSLISDYGRALGSSAYMVKLIRKEQAEWKLGFNCFEIEDFENNDSEVWGPVLKKVFEEGSNLNVREEMKKAIETKGEKTIEEESEDAPAAKRRKVEAKPEENGEMVEHTKPEQAI